MNPDLNDQQKNKPPHQVIGAWVAVGAGVGGGIGAITEHFAVGNAIGIGVGAALEASLRSRK